MLKQVRDGLLQKFCDKSLISKEKLNKEKKIWYTVPSLGRLAPFINPELGYLPPDDEDNDDSDDNESKNEEESKENLENLENISEMPVVNEEELMQEQLNDNTVVEEINTEGALGIDDVTTLEEVMKVASE